MPVGTLARGKTLVEGDGGRTFACGMCHGATMQGQAFASGAVAPRLAGQHPIDLVRQLYLFKDGSRTGSTAELMTPAVENLTDADILAIAAYLASIDPTQAK